jgi:hypothetical protein
MACERAQLSLGFIDRIGHVRAPVEPLRTGLGMGRALG